MANNFERRMAALERGNGTINIGDLLDALGDKGIQFGDPRTWPATWAGKVMDPVLLRSLDDLEPALTRYDTAEVRRKLADLPL